jgi:hypothetical protein
MEEDRIEQDLLEKRTNSKNKQVSSKKGSE